MAQDIDLVKAVQGFIRETAQATSRVQETSEPQPQLAALAAQRSNNDEVSLA